MKITSIALAALPLAAAEKLAGGLPVDCVAFQDADSSLESTVSTLGMGRCLKSGDAICSSTGSSTGSWAFGIDRTDGTVKLWEDDRVLFASSEWADANVLCIGGNAAEYGPHEYNWYDEAAPYLFVSYDAGRSKAFLDCSSGGLTSAGSEAHLEINHIAESNIRMSGAPIVAFQDGAGTSSLWSIDAWGAAQTNSGCEWRTDAVGFTAELAAGEDFSSQMGELVGLEQEEDEVAEDGTRTKNYILRAGMRDRWGDDDKGGDDKPHYDRTRWGEVLQARASPGASPTCAPKSSKAPSAGKGSNQGRNLSSKSTKSPSAGTSSPSKAPSASSSSKSSKCSDKSSKSPKSTKAPSVGTAVTVVPISTPTKSPSKSAKSTKSPSKSVKSCDPATFIEGTLKYNHGTYKNEFKVSAPKECEPVASVVGCCEDRGNNNGGGGAGKQCVRDGGFWFADGDDSGKDAAFHCCDPRIVEPFLQGSDCIWNYGALWYDEDDGHIPVRFTLENNGAAGVPFVIGCEYAAANAFVNANKCDPFPSASPTTAGPSATP